MRRAAILLLVAGTALLGCGDDGDDGDTADELDTTTTEAVTGSVGEATDDGGVVPAGCAEAAEGGAGADALAAFPDNPDVTWTVLGVREGGLGTVLVELEPDPDAVGYPSFTFVYGCGTGDPERLATYALDGGDYVLLATTDAAAGIDFAPVLEE